MSDMFPEESMKIQYNNINSVINEKNVDFNTSSDHGLFNNIKCEFDKEETKIEFGVTENQLLEEEVNNKFSLSIAKLHHDEYGENPGSFQKNQSTLSDKVSQEDIKIEPVDCKSDITDESDTPLDYELSNIKCAQEKYLVSRMNDEDLGHSPDEVPLLQSDSESDSNTNPPPTTNRRKQNKTWIYKKTFHNSKEAEEAVKKENCWSVLYTHNTEAGRKTYYRCAKVKRRGIQCSAAIYLLFHADSDNITLFRTEANHNHESIESRSKCTMGKQVREEINKLFDLHLKPKAIMTNLSKMEGIELPSLTQLNNYLSGLRRKKFGSSTINLGELEGWLQGHSQVPDDDHSFFVISYETNFESNVCFRFVLSTKFLIGLARDCNLIHCDATYKLIWQGFPVLIIGTSDRDHKFHPFALTVATTEQKSDFIFLFNALKTCVYSLYEIHIRPEVLICDAAKSIQNGFIEVFGPNVTVRMCWAHAKKNIMRRIEQVVQKSSQKEMLQDLDILQLAVSSVVFENASKAFFVKWKDEERFLKYFDEEWLTQNRNWYLGAALGTPATNNGLESFNRAIKDSNTLRERHPLSRFLVVASDMVNEWSLKYKLQNFTVSKQPTISLKQWTEAYQWAKLPKKVTIQNFDNGKLYKIPSGQSLELELFDATWKYFDDYKKQCFSGWEVNLPNQKEDWMQGSCNCPAFNKTYICKHVIGMAIRLKCVIPPTDAKNINIGEKRKRGRPTRARKALIVQ